MRRTSPLALSTFVLAGVLAVTLSACAGGSATPTASPTSAPTPTQTAEPEPTPTEPAAPTVAPANLPTDCTTLGTDMSRQDTVGDMTLQSDGTGFEREAPQNAQLALGCDWILDEVAGVLLLISTADAAAVSAAADALPAEGWTCGVADDFGAAYCYIEPADMAGVQQTVVARDDVWVYLETYQRDGNAFLSDIASQIWS
ncbi:hypothetical protein NQ152_09020 [Microbacterium sp. zg.B48]|uniref:hypothetical protein n=1 Tax=Microbacterium sp. zg.B48 TaxID=2969408 RepID=UPI00214C2C85|nr:hypothetical protein [Microbacterium sp. zg.B48]MCR2763649.1 hypothetical protein [Microbacterium sp. zg.B48]